MDLVNCFCQCDDVLVGCNVNNVTFLYDAHTTPPSHVDYIVPGGPVTSLGDS